MLDESGFYIYAGALPGGAQRQANLDRLVDVADGFEAGTSGSLTRFLAYTERLCAKGGDDVAHILGENDDVVRLMTIHKSKGLEFRVVFGAQLAKAYGGARKRAAQLHRDLGIDIRITTPNCTRGAPPSRRPPSPRARHARTPPRSCACSTCCSPARASG